MTTRWLRPPHPPIDENASDALADALTPADEGEVLHRPDGYHWVSADGRQTFGPFETAEAARADRDSGDEESLAPEESLQEVEADLGLADWIDPETGVPAEGLSTPHLVDE